MFYKINIKKYFVFMIMAALSLASFFIYAGEGKIRIEVPLLTKGITMGALKGR